MSGMASTWVAMEISLTPMIVDFVSWVNYARRETA
jgi:hypothetical protein